MLKHVHVHVERSHGKINAEVMADCGCTRDSSGAGMTAAKKKPAAAAGKVEKPAPPLTSLKTYGAAGGNLAHHREKSKHHAKQAEKCDDSELSGLHNSCSNSHAMAAHYLQSAQHHEGGTESMTSAQRHANVAGQYEAKIKGHKPKTKDVQVADDWAKWNAEHKKTAAHHHARAAHHEAESAKHPHGSERRTDHEMAAVEHKRARNALEYAEQTHKHSPVASEQHMAAAKHAAGQAEHHEKNAEARKRMAFVASLRGKH